MPLQNFKLPAPDSRLVIHNGVIYKIKLIYKYVKASAFLPCAPGVMQREVEAALRAILHKDNRLQPLKIKTGNFLVDGKLEPWPASRKLLFEEHGTEVPACREKIVLTVQPRPGRRSSGGYSMLEVDKQYSNSRMGPKKTNRAVQNRQKRKSGDTENTLSATKKKRMDVTQKKIATKSILSPENNNLKGIDQGTGENETFHRRETKAGNDSELSDDDSEVFPTTSLQVERENRRRASKYDANQVRNSSVLDTSLVQQTSARNTLDVSCDSASTMSHNREPSKSRRNQHTGGEISHGEPDQTKVRKTTGRPQQVKTPSSHKESNMETELSDAENRQASVKPKTRSDIRKSMDCFTVTKTSKKRSAQGRSGKNLKRMQPATRSYSRKDNTESELSADEISQGSSDSELLENKKDPSEPRLRTRYSLRNSRTGKKLTKGASVKPITSTPQSSTRVQTRAKSVADKRKIGPKYSSPLISDNDSVIRRSKRLKSATENQDRPANERAASKKNEVKGSKKNNSLVNTGTQTQGSTYRIKNADMKLLKQLAVPSKKVDPQQSGQRPKRMLTSYPSTSEDIGTRSTNREAVCYLRDRTLIQQEELAEEMKLQQMASSSSQVGKAGAMVSRDQPPKRRSSILSTLQDFLTPMKNMFK